jgi:hypothetical protein
MPKLAQFDPSVVDPKPIIGWYDTDTYTYTDLPDAGSLLVLSEDQWDARLTAFSWVINGGVPMPAPPPAVSMAEQASVALTTRLAAGIAITSAGLPSATGTYALDLTSTAQVFQIGSFAGQWGMFPSGLTTQLYPDITGITHVFDLPTFIAFFLAVARVDSALNTQAGVMANGGSPSWPSQTVGIV